MDSKVQNAKDKCRDYLVAMGANQDDIVYFVGDDSIAARATDGVNMWGNSNLPMAGASL